MHWCHGYCCLLCSHCLVSSHNTLYSPFEREHVALREQITAAKEATLTATPLTERKKIIHLSLVVPKIQFHLILL